MYLAMRFASKKMRTDVGGADAKEDLANSQFDFKFGWLLRDARNIIAFIQPMTSLFIVINSNRIKANHVEQSIL